MYIAFNSWTKMVESRKEQKSDLQNSVQLVTFNCTQRLKQKMFCSKEISIGEVSAHVTKKFPSDNRTFMQRKSTSLGL